MNDIIALFVVIIKLFPSFAHNHLFKVAVAEVYKNFLPMMPVDPLIVECEELRNVKENGERSGDRRKK